jgi:very-short-patch-repair endonuclease
MTTLIDGIPVTKSARTISDLRRAKPSRGGATGWELRRSLRQAAVLGLDLGPGVEPERTRSDLEVLFQQICRRHRIPASEVNEKVGPFEVDFLWRDRRVIVETDGYVFHRGRIAFEDDHDRDLHLAELGFRVLRFSEYQLEREPARAAGLVRRELAASSSAHG